MVVVKVIILIDSIILLHDSLRSKMYHIQVCGLMNGHNQIRYRYRYAWMNLPICTHYSTTRTTYSIRYRWMVIGTDFSSKFKTSMEIKTKRNT